MQKTYCIGIFGGSFNPPHRGHLHASLISLKKLKLKKLLWLISVGNPLKDHSNLDSYESRYKACKKLTNGHPKIYISSLEKDFQKYNRSLNYTYNFLIRYKKIYPNHNIKFIIGTDNLISFHKWYRYKDILNMVELVVIDRGKSKYKALSSKVGKMKKFTYINVKKVDISSTEIREIKNKKDSN